MFMVPISLCIIVYYCYTRYTSVGARLPFVKQGPSTFVFGTTDPHQLIQNHLLLKGVFHLKFKLAFMRSGIVNYYLLENNAYIFKYMLRNEKKPFHSVAKEPVMGPIDLSKPICAICQTYNVNMLTIPCNHVGMCNICVARMFETRCKSKSHMKLSNNEKRNVCPFCNSHVKEIKYIYIV